MHGPWEEARLGAFIRPQTSIADIKKVSVPIWFSGLNPSKINLGMAYYGRGYTVQRQDCADIECPYSAPSRPGRCTDSPGVLSLTEIKETIRLKNLVPKLIPKDMIKQITFEDQWMGYDDKETISLKTRWADQHCLGGTATWSIDFNSGTGRSVSKIGDFAKSANNDGSDAHSPPTLPTSPGSAALLTSKDGSCGGKQTCKNSSLGNCCSPSGFCGNSEPYCGNGCQKAFGTCAIIAVSPNNPTVTISIDGTCGPVRNVTCDGSPFGSCCSRYGWCGDTGTHCDVANGCQSRFGTCQ